jgi:hypothetical protein
MTGSLDCNRYREELSNPHVSDRSHRLFESSYPRLRHFLLGDANI